MNVFLAHIDGKQALLSEEESWHCVKVLRKKAGDAITVIDGRGRSGEGLISLAHPKQCTVALDSTATHPAPRPYRLHVAIAPTKNMDRIEWFAEKAVEIGIDELSFIQCRNSERVVLKTDRIRKILESALKQSLQYYLPALNELTLFPEFISGAQADIRLIAHCEETQKQHLRELAAKERSHLVLIGPEGDFTHAEIELAKQKGFAPVSLGATRLRTETAGLYACNALSALLS